VFLLGAIEIGRVQVAVVEEAMRALAIKANTLSGLYLFQPRVKRISAYNETRERKFLKSGQFRSCLADNCHKLVCIIPEHARDIAR
jgi:hypothetical protein